MESATLLYCRCDAASSIRAATSLGRDRLVCVVAHIFSPEGSTGISTEATGNAWANRPYLTSSVSKANDFQFISPLCAGETAGEVFLFNHFHSPGAVFLSSNEES